MQHFVAQAYAHSCRTRSSIVSPCVVLMRGLCARRSNPDDNELPAVASTNASKKTKYSDGSAAAGQFSASVGANRNSGAQVYCACCGAKTPRVETADFNTLDLPVVSLKLLNAAFRKKATCAPCGEVCQRLGKTTLQTNARCMEYYLVWLCLLRRDYDDGIPAVGSKLLVGAMFRHGCKITYDRDFRITALSKYIFLCCQSRGQNWLRSKISCVTHR